jgi:hypothetical protein
MIQPMPEEARLPELARSLRALGAAHGAAAESAHAAVFGPLLDARALAAMRSLDDACAVFRGQALAARIVARAADAAREGALDAASARARVARAREALEPLRSALLALDTLAAPRAADATSASSSVTAEWQAHLLRIFRIADEACVALTRVLADREEGPVRRSWFGRFGR